jgi:hypothetical protein
MFWNLAVIRGLYGFIGTVASVYATFFDAEISSHVTKSRTALSYLISLSHFGFFSFEMCAQVFFDIYFRTFSKALLAHHVIAIIGCWTTAYGDTAHYLAISTFIDEMSTPFSCICFCLMKSNMTDSFLWKANQLVLIHVFHMRSMFEVFIICVVVKNFDAVRQLSTLYQANLYFGLVMITLFLTPYWTYRKTEQFFLKKGMLLAFCY